MDIARVSSGTVPAATRSCEQLKRQRDPHVQNASPPPRTAFSQDAANCSHKNTSFYPLANSQRLLNTSRDKLGTAPYGGRGSHT